MVLKMKMIAIKKSRSKLKDWSVEMPNAPYSNRYGLNKEEQAKIINRVKYLINK